MGRVPPSRSGGGVGGGTLPHKIVYFFHFKIMHSGAFSYTNSKVLFPIKCRHVIMVFYDWQ